MDRNATEIWPLTETGDHIEVTVDNQGEALTFHCIRTGIGFQYLGTVPNPHKAFCRNDTKCSNKYIFINMTVYDVLDYHVLEKPEITETNDDCTFYDYHLADGTYLTMCTSHPPVFTGWYHSEKKDSCAHDNAHESMLKYRSDSLKRYEERIK